MQWQMIPRFHRAVCTKADRQVEGSLRMTAWVQKRGGSELYVEFGKGPQRDDAIDVNGLQETPFTRVKAGIQVYSPRCEPAFDESGGCSRSSTKVMVSGWPATAFPSASVNGKDAHRLSICATAMRYDERSISDASLD